MNINEYILQFDSSEHWFLEEIEKAYHKKRISDVVANKYYLNGRHKVLNREDTKFKGKELVTRKILIQYLKTVLRFHATFMVGKPVTLTGEQSVTNTFNDIYKNGFYNTIDYNILLNVLKFGDSFEYVYCNDKGKISSKVFDSGDSYPVYDDEGNYIAFIEYWTDAYSNISYWNVFYEDRIDKWNNENAELKLVETKTNISGLPIHYHNFSDIDSCFGVSLMDDLKPLLDELEDTFSKLGDAIYIHSMNPLNVSIGQRIDSSIPADATGYVLNLEGGGNFKTVSTTMDYNNIKYYIESIRTMINEVACVPAVLSNTEVSNISEMSMKMLFHLASIMSMDNEKWLAIGMGQRFDKWKDILSLKGENVNIDTVGVKFNLSTPIEDNKLVTNLKDMSEIGAISKHTIMEKSGLVEDIEVEKQRIEQEKKEEAVQEVIE